MSQIYLAGRGCTMQSPAAARAVLSPHKKGSPIAEMLISATLPIWAYAATGPFL